MNNNQESSAAGWLTALIVMIAIVVAGLVWILRGAPAQDAPATFSGIVDNVYLDAGELPTTGIVTVGTNSSTRVVSTSTGRLYLEIANIATTSPGQVLYCNTNDRPATVGQGFAIFASTTRIFTNLRTSVQCRYAAATTSVSVVDK